MVEPNLRTFEALAKAIFSRGMVEAYFSHFTDELVVRVDYNFATRELRKAALDGSRSLVDAFVERIGAQPSSANFRRHVDHVIAQRERRFSLRAARRHGRHKLLSPSPGPVAP